MPYTIKNLLDVKDFAPELSIDHAQSMRVASDELNADQIGVTHIAVKPGLRQAFAHRHDDAEEIYVVLSGTGQIKLDDEIHDVSRLDAIRISPNTTRQWQAGPDGIEILAFGPNYENDGELVHEGFWD